MNKDITGKKVLHDCVVLATDLGAYIVVLSKRMYTFIKNALSDSSRKDGDAVKAGAEAKSRAIDR